MMKIEIEVPRYTPGDGVRMTWDPAAELAVRVDGGEVVVTANPAGLRTLARLLLTLAQDGVPAHAHVHLDDSTGLGDSSAALIVERM